MTINFKDFFAKGLGKASDSYVSMPKYNFVGGHNAEENIPIIELVNSSKRVLKKYGHNLALYGSKSGHQGDLKLRRFLVKYLKSHAQISIKEENILITSGSLQALDLVNTTFLNKGDCVLIEEATYGGALARLKSRGINYFGVPVEQDGINTEKLENILKKMRTRSIVPKFLYTIPTVQNPTGTIMSNEKRKTLIDIAERYNFLVFEDDCYADLTWDRKRPGAIYSFSNSNRVVYCGSFSKSIAPAFRIGYIVADWKVISQIMSVKNDGGTGAIEQMILADFCEKNYEKHLLKVIKTLRHKCNVMIESLKSEFGSTAEFIYPQGGIFVWVKFSDCMDTSLLAEKASFNGITINPGSDWTSNPEIGKKMIRVCFANPSENLIKEGIKELASLCHKEFGFPKISSNIKRSN